MPSSAYTIVQQILAVVDAQPWAKACNETWIEVIRPMTSRGDAS